jgi:hypothetical protein
MADADLRSVLGRLAGHLERQLAGDVDARVLAARTARALAALAQGQPVAQVAAIMGCLDCPCDHQPDAGWSGCPHCGCVCPAPDPEHCAGNPDACPCCRQDVEPGTTVIHDDDARVPGLA